MTEPFFTDKEQLHLVVYKFYIKDENRVEEVLERVKFDIGQNSIEWHPLNRQNFIVRNLELQPDEGSEFIYAWEWLHERFPDCLELVTIDY